MKEAVTKKTEKTVSPEAGAEPKVKSRKKKKRLVERGRVYIQATYNNTIMTITDPQGNVIAWASAGKSGFRGPKKSTPYAAGIITRAAVEKAREFGLREVEVFVKGVGSGRESAVRALHSNGVEVLSIKDVTPIPHNGPRAKKPRRV